MSTHPRESRYRVGSCGALRTARSPGACCAAAILALGVTGWDYLWSALLDPQIEWLPGGIAVHFGVDASIAIPLALAALALGCRWAGRRGRADGAWAELLTVCGLTTLIFIVSLAALGGFRDRLHETIGNRWGVPLAVRTKAVVEPGLAVRETAQLCSFAALRGPLPESREASSIGVPVGRLKVAVEDSLIRLAVSTPLLFVALLCLYRPRLPRLDSGQRLRALPVRRGSRRLALGLAAAAVIGCLVALPRPWSTSAHARTLVAPLANACTDGGPVKVYEVSAIEVTMTLNRFGDHVDGFMYALDGNIQAIRDFEADLEADRTLPEAEHPTRVALGLRRDPIQPLVIRANLGDCLRIHFTNRLTDGEPASLHILGLPHTVANAGGAVGENPPSYALRDATVTYEMPLPQDPEAERAYYFHDHGAGRRHQHLGLFGAIVVEPRGATYLDPETGEPLDTETGSGWQAIILDPDLDGRPDAKSFREFVLLYHEIGHENFGGLFDRDDKHIPLQDFLAGIYRPASRAINYRSEPFRNRLALETGGPPRRKSLGYSSYVFGDPATPIPRSYLGEAVKTRLLHGGSEMFHVHHLHGGGIRWRRNPGADPDNDFWRGLTKVPDPQPTSIRLDSQSIGPGTSYNLEHECGSGGCQQQAGDFLYHCHIGHHYLAGMWSFWRVFDTARPDLAVVADLFQGESLLQPTAPPEAAVSAGELIGLEVDGKVLDASNLLAFITSQLPPPGQRLDAFDATVWDWIITGLGPSLQVWGEPETTAVWANYVAATPGQRPEVLFNPANGRYTWPLFRPHLLERPPFAGNGHSGAPWLGERGSADRPDGLCPTDALVPHGVERFYPITAITLPIPVTRDAADPEGMLFTLNEDKQAILAGDKPAEPLAIRSNVGDCVEALLTNEIPDGALNNDHSKVNIHSHFVQFDSQASDGVITGFSYEQSVRPHLDENRFLSAPAAAGGQTISVTHTDALRPGIWVGVGLGEGVCGESPEAQPVPCTEVRRIASLGADSITFDQALERDHSAGESVGVEFVRYRWYSDVDFGTVFFHTHVDFKDWDHGLFGAHVVEPAGSTYHHPETGEEVRSGSIVDVHVDGSGNPVAAGVDGSFRELVLFLHDNSPVEGPFEDGGGTINLRAEPFRLRLDDDPAWRFSSVRWDDPPTPLLRAYVGDPVVVRGVGVVERVGGIRFPGHRFHLERHSALTELADATFIGISERFDLALDGGAGGPAGYPGDYLYYSTLGRDWTSGAWGIVRVHDQLRRDLLPLPDREPPPDEGTGFPQLSFTGEPPPELPDPGQPCPPEAPLRRYQVELQETTVVYHAGDGDSDPDGVVYGLLGSVGAETTEALVLRANAGDCLEIELANRSVDRGAISVGELLFDPQRSYGTAVGLNPHSTVAPAGVRTFRYHADRELGIVLALNLARTESLPRGAFAAVVVEPEGSQYFFPGTRIPALSGFEADVETPAGGFREGVVLFKDEDERHGQNAMLYSKDVRRLSSLNHGNEPLNLRGLNAAPADVFRSDLWGDPRLLLTVPAGMPLTLRTAVAWGGQVHVPTLEGHRFPLEPALPGSEQMFNHALAPGMTLDMHFLGGAGGELAARGDYLLFDRYQAFMEAGLWGILRVTEPVVIFVDGFESGDTSAWGVTAP